MKLIIDLGNTLKKFAFFQRGEMKDLYAWKDFDLDELEKLLDKTPVSASILSSVIDYPDALTKLLSSQSRFIELSANTPLPIRVNYDSPETLGKDRIAAAVAGSHLSAGNNVLVVNAGTCITYDIVSAKKIYLGGAISPGIDIRYRALNTFTEHLPLIEKSGDITLTGRSTKGSIESGVQAGVIAEVEGMIDRYRQDYEDLTIILSGGDAKYFDKKLKNNIFAVPNIVLTGLNIILDFNV
ncbi:MAG: type III pantothenate kinase [Bacteroidota bacterium]|nr:type III pantothenate kinase [Bacteroidota bacterium]